MLLQTMIHEEATNRGTKRAVAGMVASDSRRALAATASPICSSENPTRKVSEVSSPCRVNPAHKKV